MSTVEILTIFAIFVGPITAVVLTRFMDHRRERRQRKIDVLRTLMKTRRDRLSYDHVGTLNLVELEFYGVATIKTTYRNYIEHLGESPPPIGKDKTFFDTRADRFADLLKAIGDHLGFRFDKADLERLGYFPLGWEQNQLLAQANAQLVNEVLRGTRPLPITPLNQAINSPFPPPPDPSPLQPDDYPSDN